MNALELYSVLDGCIIAALVLAATLFTALNAVVSFAQTRSAVLRDRQLRARQDAAASAVAINRVDAEAAVTVQRLHQTYVASVIELRRTKSSTSPRTRES